MSQGVEFWSAHLSAIGTEGVTAKVYAQQHGLSVSSLYDWRRQLKQTGALSEASGLSAFVQVASSQGTPATCFCLWYKHLCAVHR